MKALWLVVLLIAVASAEARPAPRRVQPPLDRNCREIATWELLKTCIETNEKDATITTLSSEIKQVTTKGLRQYVYAKLGERWMLIYRPGDGNYELGNVTTASMLDLPAKRIELSHHVQIGNNGMFTERVTMICPIATGNCVSFVTACTVMQRGRAIETFRGEIVAADDRNNGFKLVGDRTHTGQNCRGR
jgi:hypothetical protein